jgi:hypothetical protein
LAAANPELTMPKHIVRLLLVSLSLAACGGDSGLVAQGSFTLTAADFRTGIALPNETRIDAGGLVTGTCTITDSPDGRTVAIDLFTRGSAADNEVRRASIAAREGSASATLGADIGLRTYSSAACAASVDVVDENGSAVLSTDGACTLTAPDGTSVEAEADLVIFGCRVLSAP